MSVLFKPSLFLMFLSAVTLGAKAQTPSSASTTPPWPSPPALGPVEIERLDAPGLAVAQDHEGFLWFAGQEGLARYDGYGFTPYQHDPHDSTSLSYRWIESLHVDSSGTLWIGTFGGGLHRFDATTETFTRYAHDPSDPMSLSQDTVTVILEGRRGTLWVGTHGGLNRFDRETETFTHFRHDPNDPKSLSCDQVRALYEDRQGTLWVGTGSPTPSETPAGEGGLNRFDPATGTFTRYLHNKDDLTSLIHNQVMSMYEDSRGIFYVGTLGDGLHTMDREAGTFTRHRYDPSDPTKLSRPYLTGTSRVDEGCVSWACGGVSFIYEDRQGMLWVGGIYGGINRYDVKTGAMSHHESATSGLVDNTSWTMAESHDGTLWVGTWGGMHKVVASVNTFPHYVPNPTDPGSLGGSFVASFHEDHDGLLWIGLLEGGLDRLDRSTGVFTHFRHDPNDPTSLGWNTINVLYGARDGALWVGHDVGLSRYDRSTGRFIRFNPDPNDPTSLSNSMVRDVKEDRQGRLWVGTWRAGLDRYDPATGIAVHHRHNSDDPGSLSDNYIHSLYEDRAGTLWIGTTNGLNRLIDRPEATFMSYLSGRTVTAVYEDRAWRFWVGTWGDGLYLFDREAGEVTRYGLEDGLPSVNVAGLVEDNDGYLWVSTAEGVPGLSTTQGRLSRLDPKAETFTNFDVQDGLPDIGFWPTSALRSRDGTLFFGGNGGFTAFDPATIREPVYRPPKMALTGLRVFNDEVIPGLQAPLKAPIHRAEEIQLSYDQNYFTIDYTGLAFRDPEGLQYQYRLENHDVGWVSVQAQRSARYSGLSPGTYVFRVQAVDSRGLRSAESASIRVVIRPPWWHTVWAYGFYGLVLIGGTFAVARFQRRRLIRKERERARARELEQARQLEQAHKELQKTHAHLKATQAQLLQKEKMASLGQLTSGIAHEIKNPLNFINNFAELNKELAQELREAIANGEDVENLLADLEQNAQVIAQHGKRADDIVRSMMQHTWSGSGQREAIDINQLVTEHINLAYHSKRAQLPGLAVEIKRDLDKDVEDIEVVPRDIGRVLLNLLGNAFDAVHEYANKTGGDYVSTVTVSTRKIDSGVEIRVSDNGPGIPEEIREKIFEPFFTTKPTGSGTGLGLSLAYEIVTQGHRGTLSVETVEGKGAMFVVTLPCKTTRPQATSEAST